MSPRAPLLALWLLGCSGDASEPATPGSPSARLAERTATLSLRARDVADRADALASEFDALRAQPEADHRERLARLREEAAALEVLAQETQAELKAIEASAQVW